MTLAGHLIESVIGYYLTGISGLDISWFPERTQVPEVDFVITVGLSRIPLEVKYRHRPVNEQDLRGVRSFCAQTKYNAPLGLIVTLDEFRFIDDQIVVLPAYALLAMR